MAIFGNNSANHLDGTGAADTIWGLGGDDILHGFGGSDLLIGGAGADDIDGGSGSDTSSYQDSTSGVTVSLVSNTGSGGYAEGDTLNNIENLYGSSHNDFLIGNDSANILSGLSGNDTLKGGGGADTLYGDSGQDTLKGGGGADQLNGGSGIDTASYFDSGAGVFVWLGGDTASGGDAEGDELNQIENLTGSAYADDLWGSDGVNVLNGNDGADSLKGFGGADTLNGGNGNDDLFGMDGDDTLDGGAGADDMDGGAGNDLYFVDNAGDEITETGAGTTDTVVTTTSYVLTAGANVEFLQTTSVNGTAAINLTGNETSQQVTGNNGANTLSGGLGNDTLVGYAGMDTFLFDSALDGTYNVDVIFDFNQSDDVIALDKTIFSALGTDVGHYLTGNEFTIGAAAADADDRIIYNSDTGALMYDADGVGGADAIQFATLATGLTMVNDDFIVV